MNIFVLDENPVEAARMMCDKHIPKMILESAQMMASALRRHGAGDELMPLNQQGRPYKGGYHNHPCTVWTGESVDNYLWLYQHAHQLCVEYRSRFNNGAHVCEAKIGLMTAPCALELLPLGGMTPFARAFNAEQYPFLYDEKRYTAVEAYRTYYSLAKRRFAQWNKGTPAPSWWATQETEVKE